MQSCSLHAGFFLAIAVASAQPVAQHFDDAQARQFLQTNCGVCHSGKARAGGFAISSLNPEQIQSQADSWTKAAHRVHNGEMPPKAALSVDQREAFAGWVQTSLRKAACVDGLTPGPAPIRRLSRSQYTATVRDLLNLHVDTGAMLPAEGAGGEGFDNAAETLFLSPISAPDSGTSGTDRSRR